MGSRETRLILDLRACNSLTVCANIYVGWGIIDWKVIKVISGIGRELLG